MLSAKGCIDAATDTAKFDRLTENDVALAYLPLAWVGDHYLNYAQGLAAGFCMACPGGTGDGRAGSARDRADASTSRRRACSKPC